MPSPQRYYCPDVMCDVIYCDDQAATMCMWWHLSTGSEFFPTLSICGVLTAITICMCQLQQLKHEVMIIQGYVIYRLDDHLAACFEMFYWVYLLSTAQQLGTKSNNLVDLQKIEVPENLKKLYKTGCGRSRSAL